MLLHAIAVRLGVVQKPSMITCVRFMGPCLAYAIDAPWCSFLLYVRLLRCCITGESSRSRAGGLTGSNDLRMGVELKLKRSSEASISKRMSCSGGNGASWKR